MSNGWFGNIAQPARSMALELERYIKELESINAECMRPKADGRCCPQCYERKFVILRLREILASEPRP